MGTDNKKDDDKAYALLYDQLKDLKQIDLAELRKTLEKCLDAVTELKNDSTDKKFYCQAHTGKFTRGLNRVLGFIQDLQKQSEILIIEVKKLTDVASDHSKQLDDLTNNYNRLAQAQEGDEQVKKDLDKRINTQENYSTVAKLLIAFLGALLVLIINFDKIIPIFKKVIAFLH